MEENKDYITFKDYIENKLGLKIVETNYRAVSRFIDERLRFYKCRIGNYIEIIQKDQDELHKAINIVTINETYFFREHKYYRLLDEQIFKDYKLSGKVPTCWSAASSIGAEALSIALIINKNWGLKGKSDPRILATDVDSIALSKINENMYSKRLMKSDGSIFHTLITANSTNCGDDFSLNNDIIKAIRTQQFNLVKDDYSRISGTFDIVFLCNLLTYMDNEYKKKIINSIVPKINKDGYLILSSSDTAFIEHSELQLEQNLNSFYFRKL